MKIVFFGSPPFAIPALEKLHETHEITLVVTQPDRPKGRGRKLAPTPVKKRALELGIPVISPKAIKTQGFWQKIANEQPDYLIVTAYGRIIPDSILEIPKIGAYNIHPSLLPLYRGPAPVNWTLINSETTTGVTIIDINSDMDAGNIIMVKELKIDPAESAGDLLERTSRIGGDLLVEILNRESSSGEKLPRTEQNHELATYAPFINSSMGKIEWTKDAKSISGLIRGFDPKPGAFAFWGGKRVKLFYSLVVKSSGHSPGTIVGMDENGVVIACGTDAVSIGEMQMPGKKRLLAKQVMAGIKTESYSKME